MSWICLMYHDVAPRADTGGGGPQRFSVPLDSFETMLDVIQEGDRVGCSVAEALGGTDRHVAISFDDGTLGQYAHAFPALLARGMTATFFVTTDWVGKSGYVTWSQLREMTAAGMSVQSHTMSHPFLSEVPEDQLVLELLGSKAVLDEELGQDTTQISLPGGDAPRRRFRPHLATCGYTVVAGSRWGVNRRGAPAFVKRCTMRGETNRDFAKRVLSREGRLALARSPREALLNSVRSALGPTRYARWRRALLDRIS